MIVEWLIGCTILADDLLDDLSEYVEPGLAQGPSHWSPLGKEVSSVSFINLGEFSQNQNIS